MVLLLVVLVAGLYLSDGLVLWMLKVDAPLAWNTWLRYIQVVAQPDYAAYAGTIKLAGGLGFGLPLLAWLVLLILLFKPRTEALHGDASFAGLGDLGKAGLLKRTPQALNGKRIFVANIYIAFHWPVVRADSVSGNNHALHHAVGIAL